MKNYKQVVEERYELDDFSGRGIENNIYARINNVGNYGFHKQIDIIRYFIKVIMGQTHKRLDEIQILDCGCGDGLVTRILAELLGNPDFVYGMEYSGNRLSHCKVMNPAIHYEYGDLTKKIPFDIQFDAIVTFTVFMHFNLEEEIVAALNNIYNSLKSDGFFLWYDCNEKSHWDAKTKDIDGWGFSADEMDNYALNAGFKLVKGYGIYSRFPLLNTSTVYLAEHIKNIWILELLEKLPFRRNNNIRIYYKG